MYKLTSTNLQEILNHYKAEVKAEEIQPSICQKILDSNDFSADNIEKMYSESDISFVFAGRTIRQSNAGDTSLNRRGCDYELEIEIDEQSNMKGKAEMEAMTESERREGVQECSAGITSENQSYITHMQENIAELQKCLGEHVHSEL
jgi:hypothetical protein